MLRAARRLSMDRRAGKGRIMITQLKKELDLMEMVLLNPELKSSRGREFEQMLSNRIIGQQRAVQRMSGLYQMFLAGMSHVGRPIGTMLFLGPTGTGKTRVVEAAAEVLFGDPTAVIKIDCAEFQHSHEIAKLIGSPPGYIGHRETGAMLTQENLDRYQTKETPLSFVLFDEIEKASDALWQLLLGILDKATLTLGDNSRVDFSRTIVIMTSNLGAREMSDLMEGGIGFAASSAKRRSSHYVRDEEELDGKMYRAAMEAARRKFSPEFMNRIDKVVVFRSLKEQDVRRILELELSGVQERIMLSAETPFLFQCSERAKEMLLEEGIDYRYGARHLKRAIERLLVFPFSNLVASHQIGLDALVYVDADPEAGELTFSKRRAEVLVGGAAELAEETEDDELRYIGVGTGFPQRQAVSVSG
jgi:ATP-dependent Clp protease ATP-binding subunit ClpB